MRIPVVVLTAVLAAGCAVQPGATPASKPPAAPVTMASAPAAGATTPPPATTPPATAVPKLASPPPLVLPPLAAILPKVAPTAAAGAVATRPPTPAPLPTLPAVALASAAPFHEGGVVFENPFGYPASVAVTVPGGVIGSNGANYALLDDALPKPSAFLKLAFAPYVFTTTLIDLLLKGAEAGHLQPDKDYTFPDEQKSGKMLTARLTIATDHANLAVYRGTASDPAKQVIGLTWTSPAHGRAVFHTLPNDGDDKPSAFVTVFDHEAHRAVVDDVIVDPSGDGSGQPSQAAAHLVVGVPDAPASGAAFVVRAQVTIHKQADKVTPTYLGVAANFLPDDAGGAMWVAFGNADTGNQVLFMPVDGTSFGRTPPAPHAFSLDGKANDLPADAAPPRQQVIMPGDGELPSSFPNDPGVGDPFADPRFVF